MGERAGRGRLGATRQRGVDRGAERRNRRRSACPTMNRKLTLHATVPYSDVDRTEVLLLKGVFKYLQEAAIAHANLFDTGTAAIATRGETWVLNRIAVGIHRYPRYDEKLRIETWSRGIKGFKGYREFRVFDAADQPLFTGSSLWLYVSVRTKSIVRVPAELAATFPKHDDGVFCPELETLEFAAPVPEASRVVPIAIRFSDIDVNDHVNNAAYPDLLQAALARAGLPPRPQRVTIKYAKAVPAEMEQVNVRLEPQAEGARFSIEEGDTVFAVGEIG